MFIMLLRTGRRWLKWIFHSSLIPKPNCVLIPSLCLLWQSWEEGRGVRGGRGARGVSCQNLGCKKIAPPSIRLPVTQSWLIVCREETCCSEPRLAWGKMSLPLSSQCTQTYRHLITAGRIRSRHGGDALCGVLNWLMESVHVGEDDDQRLLLIQVKRHKERQRFQLLSALCAFLSYQWRVIDFFSRFFFVFSIFVCSLLLWHSVNFLLNFLRDTAGDI